MDKRTLIAVVLSVVIISVFFAVQAIFFPNTLSTKVKKDSTTPAEVVESEEVEEGTRPTVTHMRILPVEEERQQEREVVVSTGVFHIKFSTKGANLRSLALSNYKEVGGDAVEMVLSGETGQYPFSVFLEDYDTGEDIFSYYTPLSPGEWEFTKRYVYREGGDEIPFTLRKKYTFKKNDYLMEVRISLVTEERQDIPIRSYTVNFGPQIGPDYEKLDGRNEYRRFIYYSDGKRKDYSSKVKKDRKDIEDRFSWLAVEGKYFLVVGISYISDIASFKAGFDGTPIEGLKDQSSFYFDRTVKDAIKVEDGYKFYIGPKKSDILSRYSVRDKNEWQESGLHLEKAVPSDFWGWLSSILKWLLEMFYSIVPNWGVAIILLTILIKIVFFPLTHKSFESTHKMQQLGPKVEELKQRYKNNTQKMNQEMAALYKREGVNPLGGCLPLLLQLPIFFALYSLFYNYFELRGAAFISPWIADLSAPERVLTLPFSIPFLGPEMRLLPFVMLATTFIQQRITQTPGQTQRQSKMLMYALPAFFFFIMYNMPSGLLLYWTMQGLFTFLTQFYINHRRAKNQDATGDNR
jgi:YidC/Oxa1 family membrane protein insertase